jgi:hypothetical protein
MGSPPGEYCKECEIGSGCKIWKNVPKHCKSYKCFYRQMENLDPKYRPDRTGIVFEKATDTIFYGTIDNDLSTLNDVANEMIKIFLDRGFSVVLNRSDADMPFVFNTEGRTAEDVWKEIKEAAWQHQLTLQT